MRDFIARYVAVNQREASPTFLFGESYGGPRAAVLAHLMLAAGMRLDGVVLLSPALDYNSNCAVFAPATISCEGFFPSYGLTGAWFALTRPVPTDADAYAGQLRDFAATTYGPAATAWALSAHAGRRPTLLEPAGRPHRRAARRLDRQRRPRCPDLPQPAARRPAARPLRRAHRRAARQRAGGAGRSVVDPDQRAVRGRGAQPLRRRARLFGDGDLRAGVERDRRLGLQRTTAGRCPTRCPTWRRRWRSTRRCAPCRSPATTTWRRRSARPSSTWRGSPSRRAWTCAPIRADT